MPGYFVLKLIAPYQVEEPYGSSNCVDAEVQDIPLDNHYIIIGMIITLFFY